MITPMTPSMMAEMLRKRPEDAHKGMLGHALLVAGSHGISGCAVLSAEACLRTGNGKLTVASPEENRIILQVSVPEAIVSVSLPAELRGFQGIGIGPGIGADAHGMVEACLREPSVPMVLDADALHILADSPGLAEYFGKPCILTPHIGEMRHLCQGFGLDGQTMLDCALKLATTHGCTVVLKGHPTHICQPDGTVYSCPRGNAGMATAGSGDVLTGIIASLLAQGYSAHDASLLGVWLHASAGDFAAGKLGEECLIARDITRHLPLAFKELHEYKKKNNNI